MSTGAFAVSGARFSGLLWTLVRTDFKLRYHGTIAGFLWALLKPLAMILVLMGVFSFIFGGKENYALHLVIALLLYEFFSDATKSGLRSLRAKGYLLTKARVPLWIIVATSISNAAITLSVVVTIFILILGATGHVAGPVSLSLLIVYLAHYLVIVVGISLATSVLFLRYRDLHEIWDVVTQAGFFLTPIIYPLDILPHRLHFYLYLWPPTPIIQFSRLTLIDGRVPSWRAHLLLSVETVLILLAGLAIFRRLGTRAAEHV